LSQIPTKGRHSYWQRYFNGDAQYVGQRRFVVGDRTGKLMVRVKGDAAGAGLFVAVTVSRLVSSLLFGVAPGDPLTFFAAATLLAVVSLAACSVPAWRAARVEPTQAFRQSA
jgi:hypothetical protein